MRPVFAEYDVSPPQAAPSPLGAFVLKVAVAVPLLALAVFAAMQALGL